MLEGFEDLTAELTLYEQHQILPTVTNGLSKKIGKAMAVTNARICEGLATRGKHIAGPRLRKVINYIRNTGLVPGLVASSEGYYVADNPEEMESWLKSLRGRRAALDLLIEKGEEHLRCLNEKFKFQRAEK